MHCFPIRGRNHLNRIPGTAVEKRSIRSFARAFLTADAKIRIDFDASEWRMIFVRHPEHAGFDRAVFDAGRGTGATCAAVGRDGQYSWRFFARGFSITDRHWPMLFNDIEHALLLENCFRKPIPIVYTLT